MLQVGPYEILGELGRGAMGVVYRARRGDLDREFAVKVIAPEALEREPLLAARFQREAQAAAQLSGHPGIVAVHDTGMHDGLPYMAMDLVAGRPLDDLLADDPPTPTQCAALLAKAARAVHHAHQQGILHRDLKPGNIMVVPGDKPGSGLSPKVADFGLAKLTQGGAELTRLTHSDVVMGTPAYMPPEQARAETLDARADVYALGATLYEALGGRPPFEGDSIYRVLTQVMRHPPESLRKIHPSLAPELVAIVERCLEKAPADRYPSAEALAEDLEAWCEGRPTIARPRGPLAKAWRAARRGWVPVAIGAVVLGAIGGGVWWASQRERQREEQGSDIEQTKQDVTLIELAQQLDQAWFELMRDTLEDVLALEAHWYGRRQPPAVLQERLARIEAATTRIARSYPNTALPRAWYEHARFLADPAMDLDPLITALMNTAEDDPFPRMLLAKIRLHWTTWRSLDLDIAGHGRRKVLPKYAEDDGLRVIRQAALSDLAFAIGQPVWTHLTQGRALLAYGLAAEHVAKQEWAAARAQLADLVDDPVIGSSARSWLALACLHTGDGARASEAWATLGDRGWVDAYGAAAAACLFLAGQEDQRAGAPMPWLERGLELAGRGIGPAGGSFLCRRVRAQLHMDAAEALRAGGGDPQPHLDAALADYERLLEAQPASRTLRTYRGMVHLEQVNWDLQRGHDPRPAAERALRDFAQVLDDAAHLYVPLVNRALVHWRLADYAAATGGDPSPHFDAAQRDLDVVIAETANAPFPALMNRANLAVRRGEILVQRGQDPTPAVEACLADLAAVAPGAKVRAEVAYARGTATMLQADYAFHTGADPKPWLDRALEAYAVAIREGAPSADWRATRGSAYWMRARRSLARRENGSADVDAALADFEAALQLNPKSVPALINRASVHRGVARWAAPGNRAERLQLALADLNRAAALSPGHRSVLHNRGLVHNSLGDEVMDAGGDARPHYERALQDLDELVRRLPGYAPGWQSRGVTRIDLAMAQWNAGVRDVAALLKGAAADLQHAIELDPSNWLAFDNLAKLYLNIEQYDMAIRTLEQALQHHPGSTPLTQLLAQARRLAGK